MVVSAHTHTKALNAAAAFWVGISHFLDMHWFLHFSPSVLFMLKVKGEVGKSYYSHRVLGARLPGRFRKLGDVYPPSAGCAFGSHCWEVRGMCCCCWESRIKKNTNNDRTYNKNKKTTAKEIQKKMLHYFVMSVFLHLWNRCCEMLVLLQLKRLSKLLPAVSVISYWCRKSPVFIIIAK